jgi:hypothetical protein
MGILQHLPNRSVARASNKTVVEEKPPDRKRLHIFRSPRYHYGLSRNGLLLISVPGGVVTVINPVVAPLGTVVFK